jgi:hypothetical protein
MITLFTAIWAFGLPSNLNMGSGAKHMTTLNINFIYKWNRSLLESRAPIKKSVARSGNRLQEVFNLADELSPVRPYAISYEGMFRSDGSSSFSI